MVDFTKYIPGHSICEGLTEGERKCIEQCASLVHFNAGQSLFTEGQEARNFYIILSGQVSIETKNGFESRLQIQQLAENEIIGWSWLFDNNEWNFTARAIEFTRAIAFSAEQLRNELDANPLLGYKFVKQFSYLMMQRLQRTRQLLMQHAGQAGRK